MQPCDLQFVCGKAWEGLAPIALSEARYCGDCRKAVFMVKTTPQLLVASALGRCVGIADDNNFIGVIGDPGRLGGFDWMAAGYFEGVSVTLKGSLGADRLAHLRLTFPKLFDHAKSEELLLNGQPVLIGELGATERQELVSELRMLAPELVATT